MAQVFVSYSRTDLTFVERLANDLKREGLNVWFDVAGLEGGERWGEKIQNAIRGSDYVIVVLSPESVTSQWVEREFLYATNQGKKIIPLMYRRCELPFNFLNINYIDVQGENYRLNYDKIIRALRLPPSAYMPKASTDQQARTSPSNMQPAKTSRTMLLFTGVLIVLGVALCTGLAFFLPWDRLLPGPTSPPGNIAQPTTRPTSNETVLPPTETPDLTTDGETPNQTEEVVVTSPPTEPPVLPTLPSTNLWRSNFSDASGWNSHPSYWSTIGYPDLNGDGRADLCGRGTEGINCALSNGSSFDDVTVWRTNFSDANGWKGDPAYWDTIGYPDVNGDGRADVCGRGGGGINCALSTGNSFGEATVWRDNFSDASGWNSDPAYWSTIGYPDVNGDRRADVCGRGNAGIFCALSNGSSFEEALLWRDNFSDANGWKSDQAYWGTISYPDVNGDGRADVCGRGGGGINCALSNGSSFGDATVWRDNFSDANYWNSSAAYWDTIAYPDVNGDGMADVCGRGGEGINCAISTGSSFGAVTVWKTNFSDASGWNSDAAYWGTIQYPDINGDGKADVCGRGLGGMNCSLSNGSSFGSVDIWSDEFSDANGWRNAPAYWDTIFFPDVNGDGIADICARFPDGIHCGLSTGSAFQAANP